MKSMGERVEGRKKAHGKRRVHQKMPAFFEGGSSPLRASFGPWGQMSHLRTARCFFRGACPRKKQILILFRRLRAAKLCEAILGDVFHQKKRTANAVRFSMQAWETPYRQV